VEAAFLEADMDENIYIEWPEGVKEFGYATEQESQTSCILLDKAMYGTVQAALQWFKKLVQCLLNMGMTQSKVDPCVFYLKRDNKLILLVGTHVDDCAISEKPSDILAFKK